MKNGIAASPLVLVRVDLWNELPDAPARATAAVGKNGQVTRLRRLWFATVARAEGGFDVALFQPDMKRRNTALRTYVGAQVPSIDPARGAIVLGANGESVYALVGTGSARCLGVLTDGQRFCHAAWLPFGFAGLDRDDVLHVYRSREGEAPEPLARYQLDRPVDSLGSAAPGVLAIGGATASVLHVADDGTCRALGGFATDLFSVHEYLDDMARALALLPERHVAVAGEHFRIEGIDEAIAGRDALPALVSLGPSAPMASGRDVAALTEATAEAPKKPARTAPVREPHVGSLPRYTRALVQKVLESKPRAKPLESALSLLAYPMPADLYAYVWARATRDAAVVTVYEAWLDQPPSESSAPGALRVARGAPCIDLGILANGDRVIAVLGGGRARVFELAHDEPEQRRFESFEGFLTDVCFRAEDSEVPTGLEAYLK